MPQRKYFGVIRIIVFDFELFIGGGAKEERAGNSFKLPAPDFIGFLLLSKELIAALWFYSAFGATL
jgi:hypothetical protein